MKKIEIFGENYFGEYHSIRVASRAVIVKDGQILLSYERNNDTWMIPGGGLEGNENDKECCIREVREETGYIVDPQDCFLEIDEYYEDCLYVSRYFCARIIGRSDKSLTKQEMRNGMEERWLSLNEIMDIFSRHQDYKDADEMKRGMYLREYSALCEYMKMVTDQMQMG